MKAFPCGAVMYPEPELRWFRSDPTKDEITFVVGCRQCGGERHYLTVVGQAASAWLGRPRHETVKVILENVHFQKIRGHMCGNQLRLRDAFKMAAALEMAEAIRDSRPRYHAILTGIGC